MTAAISPPPVQYPAAPSAPAPIQLPPAEILIIVHYHLRASHTTIRAHQRASSTFGTVSRTFRHAQLLSSPTVELAVSGAAEIDAALER